MIATVESIQTNFKPHLSNNQQFESASILAQTDNSTVYAVRVKEKETEREMALKIYSQDSAPPPIMLHLLNRPQKHIVNILQIKNTKPASVSMELCMQDLRQLTLNQQQQKLSAEEVRCVLR